jgi:hypothetical protein
MCLLTENKTGLEETKPIEVKVTDPNDDEDCEEEYRSNCKDPIYYFITGKYVTLCASYN